MQHFAEAARWDLGASSVRPDRTQLRGRRRRDAVTSDSPFSRHVDAPDTEDAHGLISSDPAPVRGTPFSDNVDPPLAQPEAALSSDNNDTNKTADTNKAPAPNKLSLIHI